ncbi:PHD finger protein ING1 [Aristolochia californica]|uniref:PHD finger protein ING1 n=1 Tax=Aristolochia californica TaxID=171875 RepID=UPI0035D927D9
MAFLEDFQASLDSLPSLLQRHYSVMRDLDKSLQVLQKQNEQHCEQEIEEIKRGIQCGNITPDTSLIRFSDEALDEQKHCIRISDEKICLAATAYDVVDQHIQQLDDYLRKFDEDLRKGRDLTSTAGMTSVNVDNAGMKSGRGSESGRGGRKKTRIAAAATAVAVDTPSIELDIPVDPNEPTYCFCNQVSYGEMVACDNPDCKIEWFHFGCVGLKEQPKGKWYCSNCVGTVKRRKAK